MRIEASVVRVEGDLAWVRAGGQGGCGRCEEAGGCRSDVLGDVFGKRCREYSVENSQAAQPGQQVSIEVPDGIPLRAALLAYVMPLAFVFMFATLSWTAGAAEWLVIVASALGLVCSVLLLRALRGTAVLREMRPSMIGILDRP